MKSIYTLVFIAFGFLSQAQSLQWNALLSKHLNAKGWIDYKGMQKDEAKLDAYLSYLAKTDVSKKSADYQKAFWMNAYNAYTVKLILDHYPLKSIMDIKKKGKGPWDISFARVGGETYTLNAIEHKILRPTFKDPRIHAGINCASFSCPKILNQAFTEKNVDVLLDKAFTEFVNDPLRNKISASKAEVSQLFDWFKDDFKTEGSVKNYINKFSKVKISKTTNLSYLKYNWSLNDIR